MTTTHRLGIIGYGYVGTATAHALAPVAEVAWHDPALPGSTPLASLIRWATMWSVCVPTPRGDDGNADVSAVHDVLGKLVAAAVTCPVLLRSTVPPGTTAQLQAQFPSVPLVFIPEFLRERHHFDDAATPARLVVGWARPADPTTHTSVRALLDARFPHTPLMEMSSTEAEVLKYASNALFGVRVSFANEMAALATAMGADWETIRSALVLDPRVGTGHLQVPGHDGRPGYGGSCLPKDIDALLALASSQGVPLPIVAAAARANRRWREEE